ncbi:protein transport protein sec72 [Physcia stellaris]|nr:protein transport protein sec72 [Physcia stellaris]
MSIGKFAASVLSGTQETTVALAALNFDFALFKTEAPKEYKALGSALTPYRREVAEDGDIHATARKLRAMFEQILPPTPSLYTAYGMRASEIASSSKESKTANTSELLRLDAEPGAEALIVELIQAGAVAIHLLACMLAKLWTPLEATSIWEEIVQRRKEKLATADESDPLNVFAAWAAKSTLTRQQLANWDASARAWLRAGDATNRVRQKQLKLILDNIDIPVSTIGNVYDSVIHSWTSAMIALNKLIEGMPHSIENSSILLALSAWHLFPNMSVLSSSNVFIKQDDPLIDSRGVLTLGLQSAQSAVSRSSNDLMGRGITWSLPLAFYRFYGDPVQKEKALNTDGSRISIAQLLQICMGCVFHGWRDAGFNAKKAAELMCDLWVYCTEKKDWTTRVGYQKPSSKSWFGVLAGAAKSYLACDDITQTEYTRLFNYGRRRCPGFLGVAQDFLSPISSLQQPSVLLALAGNHQGRIRLLRSKAMRVGCDPGSLIIRYAVTQPNVISTFALTTVVPPGSADRESTVHKWWTIGKVASAPRGLVGLEEGDHQGIADVLGPIAGVGNGDRFFWTWTGTGAARIFDKGTVTKSVDDIFGPFAEMALFRGNVQKDKPRILTGVPFEFVLGDPGTAAIYRILEDQKPASQVFSGEDIRTSLAQSSMDISQSGLLRHLGGVSSKAGTSASQLRSLKVLCTIVNIYEHLGDATVAMTLTSSKLYNVKWMPEHYPDDPNDDSKSTQTKKSGNDLGEWSRSKINIVHAFEPLDLDLASTFACIVMLESGNIDLSSAGLQAVMAMSAGDSLYVATRLLADPASTPAFKITRIRGNVGRAGIALLIPPDQPRTREIEPDNWNLINHDEFDGTVTDSFQSTSLHMSFTEYVLPIDTGLHGVRDTEIYFLETVISVHDRGRWMGDLKILPVFEDFLFRVIKTDKSTCTHTDKTGLPEEEELISIDSWYEFLDRPAGPVVFRARGNWMARLAAASMSVVKGHLTLVFGEDLCWRCGDTERGHLGHKKKPIFIL